MGYESGATHISDLVSTNPVGATDSRRLGDDHIRLIKAVLLTDFANINAAVTTSAAELNLLDGLTAGTVTASKFVLVDASKDIGTFGVVTAATFTGTNVDGILGANTPAAAIATTIVANTSLDINGTVVLVGTLDDDTMGTATDTTLATSESIKAYADTKIQLGGSAGTEEIFISAKFTYTGGAQTFTAQAHGLSGTPQEITGYAICTDAGGDGDFSLNDVIPLPGVYTDSGQEFGAQFWADGTNIDGIVGTDGIRVIDKASGGARLEFGTSTDWDIYVIAKYYA